MEPTRRFSWQPTGRCQHGDLTVTSRAKNRNLSRSCRSNQHFEPVHILLVEDCSGDALLAHQVLASCPVALKLHIARDGEKALQMTADPTTRRRTLIRAILREQVPALT